MDAAELLLLGLDERARSFVERWRAWRARPLAQLVGEARVCVERPCAPPVVRLFAPLYLSNPCANDCAYCGFRRSASFRRTLLTVSQALREAEALAAAGHRSLDLVTGEVPHDVFVAHVTRTVEAILRATEIERVHLNLGALSEAQYRRLRLAGARGYHLYQETYEPEVYARVHRAGPKRDFANRLLAPRRALAAGFGHLGLGILLGLAPLERDLARLAAHAASLLAEAPGLRLGFSLPRLQPLARGEAFVAAAPIEDEDFVRALLFLRREFPAADLTLTTREPAELRDQLLPLGITKISAGVSTAPGGYASPAGAAQFAVRDARSLAEVARSIRTAGLEPVTS